MKNQKSCFRKKLVKSPTFTTVLLIAATLLLSSTISATMIATTVNFEQNTYTPTQQPTSIKESDPNAVPPTLVSNIQQPRMAQWDIQFQYDVDTPGGGVGIAGAEFGNGVFLVTEWGYSSRRVFKFSNTGTYLGYWDPTWLPGTAGLRDLAFDGTYFYGSTATTTIYCFTEDGALITSWTAPTAVRAIAYDEDNDAFWVNNWATNLELVTRTGTTLYTIATPPSMYGAAWEKDSDGTPVLWIFTGTTSGGPCQVEKYTNLYTGGTNLGIQHSVSGDFGATGIAGGLFYTDEIVPGKGTLGGLMQYTPDILFGYELCDTIVPDHDVGVSAITEPATGTAQEIFTPEVVVKNYGNASEVTDVQFTISQGVSGTTYLTEDFMVWPPAGWTITGAWAQGVGSYAGGTAPEAELYWYAATGLDGLMSPAVNTVGATSLKLKFKILVDDYSGGYDVHVWTRADGADPWTDNAPWTNPHPGGNIGPTSYNIDISGDIGTGTQVMFEFDGPAYNIDYIYIDDVEISDPGSLVILYDKTVTGVTIPFEGSVDVTFPDWVNPDWLGYSNTYIDYEVYATTLLVDDNPTNDVKSGTVTLYYPFMHDIEMVSINSPPTGVQPAQTFPVSTTIKNNGQYIEGLFFGTVDIIKELVPDTLVEETFPDFTPAGPDGWTITNTKWSVVNTANAGGTAPELRFYYSPSETGQFRTYCDPIDTTGYTNLTMTFKHMVNHYTTPYTLKVETSVDGGTTWTTVWSINPTASIPASTVTILLDAAAGVGSDALQVSFTFDGYSFNINYWYIDDVDIGGLLIEQNWPIVPAVWLPIDWGTEVVTQHPTYPDVDNKWICNAEYASSPVVQSYIPNTYHAVYDTGLVSYDNYHSARLYTSALDLASSTFNNFRLKFYIYISNYGGTAQADCILRVQTSLDKVTWTEIYSTSIYDAANPGWTLVELDLSAYKDDVIYLGFVAEDGGYLDFHLDYILVEGYGTVPDYDDEVGYFYIYPGETLELTFDDWTPQDLALLTSGEFAYQVTATHTLASDENPANDVITQFLTLEYWHDVLIDEVTSPAVGVDKGLIWDNGDTDGSNGLSMLTDPRRTILDDFELTSSASINELRYFFVWNSATPGTGTDFDLAIRADAGGTPGAVIETATTVSYTETATGRIWFSRQEAEGVYMFNGIALGPGTYWIEGRVLGSTDNAFWMAQSDPNILLEECWVDYADLGGLMSSTTQFGQRYGINFQLHGSQGGPGGIDVIVAPGVQTMAMSIANDGTFPETDLDAYGDIYEFITNETVGTLVWSSEVNDINLGVGATATITFSPTYNFVDSGFYQLELELPLLVDNYPDNNVRSYGIGVDGVIPTASHTVSPTAPTGLNGWYVDDVTVTLTAEDGTEDWQSGVDMIKYRVDGGSWQTYVAPIVVSADGEHIVEYYAIDNVGNEGDIESVEFKSDQTVPVISMSKETLIPNKIKFTAECDDATSGVDYVEFWLGDTLAFTDTEAPFEYTLSNPPSVPGLVMTGKVFDKAGLYSMESIDPHSHATPNTHSSQPTARSVVNLDA